MTLPGKKINELTPASASGTQIIPVGYPNNPDTNSITVQEILDLVPTPPSSGFIKEWDNATIYEVGDVIYYSSATTKGIFEIVTRTTAGETPESSSYTKFKSISLSFIKNEVAEGGDSGYLRTVRVVIPTESFSGSPNVFLYSIETSFADADLNAAKISGSLARDGQTGIASLRIANSNDASGFLLMYIEYWGSGTLGGLFVDLKIEL